MEADKEELSRELIAAKLKVAQLSMEVDGLKLEHRRERIADAAHVEAEEESVSSVSTSTPPSPSSPCTMEL